MFANYRFTEIVVTSFLQKYTVAKRSDAYRVSIDACPSGQSLRSETVHCWLKDACKLNFHYMYPCI